MPGSRIRHARSGKDAALLSLNPSSQISKSHGPSQRRVSLDVAVRHRFAAVHAVLEQSALQDWLGRPRGGAVADALGQRNGNLTRLSTIGYRHDLSTAPTVLKLHDDCQVIAL